MKIQKVAPIFILSLLCVVFSAEAYAQLEVKVRAGSHENYDRIVFDSPEEIVYRQSQDKDANEVALSFDKKINYRQEDISVENLPLILKTDFSNNAKVSVQTVPNVKIRAFNIGNKIILDVIRTDKTKEVETVKRADEKTKASTLEEAADLLKLVKENQEPLSPEKAEPTPVEDVKEPLVISVTSTEVMGVSVFQRFGYLWIVTDQDNMLSYPSINGAEKDKVEPFDKVKIVGGSAFRTKMPKNTYIYAQGGGLSWQLILTPEKKSKKETQPERIYSSGESGKGSLIWPFVQKRAVLTLKDPAVGDEIKVVTTISSNELAGVPKQFVDLSTYQSYVGLAFLPLNDTVTARVSARGVEVDSADGLNLATQADMALYKMNTEEESSYFEEEEVTEEKDFRKIFDMKRWTMGGVRKIDENQQALMNGMMRRNQNERVESLITLAKLNLANGYAAESSGFLNVAQNIEKSLNKNPEFLALSGAAKALNSQFDLSYKSLNEPVLDGYDEIMYWRSFSLAGLEDWSQAGKILPKKISTIRNYHPYVRGRMALVLAEVALRSGDTPLAEKYLDMVDEIDGFLNEGNSAYLDYLKGELYRQKIDPERAIKYWEPLSKGHDDLYRTKAGLALTRLQLEENTITPAEAIDRMERLKYSWRGDDLEATVNKRLGEAYIQYGDFLKGLGILRSASANFKNTETGREMTNLMSTTFKDIFLTNEDMKISPIDYITIFEEFKELTPAGETGDQLILSLAEKMIEMDLLGRAAELLDHQTNFRLKGKQAGEVGLRLATVHLIDGAPEKALAVLEKAEKDFSNNATTENLTRISVLRAHAMAKLGENDVAMKQLLGLPLNEEVLRLKADISWQAAKWIDAAKTLEQLVKSKELNKQKSLMQEDASLILNWAIALNLSNNRPALMALQRQYGEVMNASKLADQFEVVTRERQKATLMSRQEMLNIVDEVNIFGDFIKSYHTPSSSSQ